MRHTVFSPLRRGEWCVGLFMGGKDIHISSKRQRLETSRTAAVDNAEALEHLQGLGKRALEEAASSWEAPKTLGSADLCQASVPTVQASVHEQPTQRPQQDIVASSIRREVFTLGVRMVPE